MNGQWRTAGPLDGSVVEDVVDVAVAVSHEVDPQPQVGDPRNERRRSAHAGIEDQRILRMAVPQQVGVRLPRAERSNLDPDAVRRVGSHPIALDDGLLGHDSADGTGVPASFSPKARARSAARTSATSVS